ncbi:DUF397 domain-containing protein [Streptomyces chumphonensis]|uniref:DUF397 domain-containing protein n=1 Tax=Streptomyces chumphonensis TaxID=1214925 RepID=A0A927F114_9ACTN|nr:DUF397 domain-containing protein [Streptomyces chumphonensis]MBD3932376.1 DUF397 domain-containing protein [Streptomyces chumphonensis]
MSEYEFRKSSYSSGSGECVEVATNLRSAVAVRDSKVASGPSLLLTPTAWKAFLATVRHEHPV